MKPQSRKVVWLVFAFAGVVGAAVAAGCNDACARSQDREIECVGSHDFDAGPPIDCEDTTACESECINDAGCDQVIAYLAYLRLDAGAPPDGGLAHPIYQCQRNCSPLAPIPQ
jgi:hypothetical protein